MKTNFDLAQYLMTGKMKGKVLTLIIGQYFKSPIKVASILCE
ncbi:hypothetical protein HMPREF1568_1314 [Providencia alcalifaciens PAL-3]|nr:hypothetical protein HMPREF1568_1314 [Providencia alcalifaciens PAL-3]EUD00183.1 hypothetical protein HMPREF1566_2131 [Providencia alcalifaciens PAL-1]